MDQQRIRRYAVLKPEDVTPDKVIRGLRLALDDKHLPNEIISWAIECELMDKLASALRDSNTLGDEESAMVDWGNFVMDVANTRAWEKRSLNRTGLWERKSNRASFRTNLKRPETLSELSSLRNKTIHQYQLLDAQSRTDVADLQTILTTIPEGGKIKAELREPMLPAFLRNKLLSLLSVEDYQAFVRIPPISSWASLTSKIRYVEPRSALERRATLTNLFSETVKELQLPPIAPALPAAHSSLTIGPIFFEFDGRRIVAMPQRNIRLLRARQGSIFDKLYKTANSLTSDYDWAFSDALLFVLLKRLPDPNTPQRGYTSSVDFSYLAAIDEAGRYGPDRLSMATRLTISAPIWWSAEEISRLWVTEQSRTIGRNNRPLNSDELMVLDFVAVEKLNMADEYHGLNLRRELFNRWRNYRDSVLKKNIQFDDKDQAKFDRSIKRLEARLLRTDRK